MLPGAHIAKLLVGDYAVGDRVRSMIDWNGVSSGDLGTVKGPCSSSTADAAARLSVEWDRTGQAWDIHTRQVAAEVVAESPATNIPPGFGVGDVVRALDDIGDHVKKGGKGLVCSLVSSAAGKVAVQWHGTGTEGGPRTQSELSPAELMVVRPRVARTLAGGFAAGTRVRSLIACGDVLPGDLGSISGPSSDTLAADCWSRFEVQWDDKGAFNALPSQVEKLLSVPTWAQLESLSLHVHSEASNLPAASAQLAANAHTGVMLMLEDHPAVRGLAEQVQQAALAFGTESAGGECRALVEVERHVEHPSGPPADRPSLLATALLEKELITTTRTDVSGSSGCRCGSGGTGPVSLLCFNASGYWYETHGTRL